MRCPKIQDLLKADYLDGEATGREQQHIVEHLKMCPQCRRLEKELQGQRLLFQKANQYKPPEHVWQNIREAIVTEAINQESRVSRGMLQRLRESMFAPRPVFALASAITAIIFVVIFSTAIIQKKQQLNLENSGEIFAGYSLNGENGDLLYDLGTNIEEYFL